MYDFNALNSQNVTKISAIMKENKCSTQHNSQRSGGHSRLSTGNYDPEKKPVRHRPGHTCDSDGALCTTPVSTFNILHSEGCLSSFNTMSATQ